jgi:hypothetical protein
MTFISKLIAGVLFGVIAAIAATQFGAAFGSDGTAGAAVMLITLLATSSICLFARGGRSAWGRGSLIAGLLFLALPVSMTMLSARAGSEAVKDVRAMAIAESRDADLAEGAATVGAGIGAGLMIGASGFFGLFLGAIFIVLALILLLGGRREVVIVDRTGATVRPDNRKSPSQGLSQARRACLVAT